MNSEIISFTEAEKLYYLFVSEGPNILNILGLISINGHWWIDFDKKESYLKVIDKHKWMLTKINYGI
jgi:hypothetical protein